MCMPAAGYDDVKTVVVLGSDPAVHKAQSKFLLGADLDLIVGKDSAVVRLMCQRHKQYLTVWRMGLCWIYLSKVSKACRKGSA